MQKEIHKIALPVCLLALIRNGHNRLDTILDELSSLDMIQKECYVILQLDEWQKKAYLTIEWQEQIGQLLKIYALTESGVEYHNELQTLWKNSINDINQIIQNRLA